MKILNVFYNIVSIIVSAVFIFTLAVKFTGTQVYAVATASMEDELYEGDMVFVRTADEYLEGDIITAKLSSGGTFTHRVIIVDSENRLVYTQGDNNPKPDPKPTEFDDILGKVVFSVPLLGDLSLNFDSLSVTIVLALVLVVLVAVRYLLFRFKKTKEDEAI